MSNTRLADLYRLNPRFMRSANLVRDFSDPTALGGYIPTEQTKTTATRLAAGLHENSGQRAWRITGDYGSGKSSFALLVANLFSTKEANLPPRLRNVVEPDEAPAKRMLPALVLGDRERISTSILRAIHLALKNCNVKKAHFKGGAGVLSALSDAQIGTTTNERAIQLIEEANDLVISSGVAEGLLIIVDELGKFLEFAANHQDSEDIYFLQLLAEAACRNPEQPLFVVALLHQGFSAYADKLSQAAQKEWQKVAERFEEIFFSHSLDQIALLIAEALNVQTEDLPKTQEAVLRREMEATLRLGWFGAGVGEKLLLDYSTRVFPLHATVLPILPKIFNRFGQNERSLFSFLLSNEPFGLQAFSQVPFTGTEVYRLHNVYDYVRGTFGHRLAAQTYRSHWNQIDSVVQSFATESDLERLVLKTVGLLNLINTDEALPTEEAVILAVAGAETVKQKQAKAVLNKLQKDRKVLWWRGTAGGYCLWPHTSVNLDEAYQDATRSVGLINRVSDSIKSSLPTRPIVARRHYIETGNMRHFEIKYCSVSELESNLNFDSAAADGRIVVPLCENQQERIFALAFAQAPAVQKHRQILFAIPQPLHQLAALVQEHLRWEWISRNVPELKDDNYAAEEVARQRSTALHNLGQQIHYFVGLQQFNERMALDFFRTGNAVQITTARELLSELSTFCDEIFPDAPKIKNELVNRRGVSSAAAGARMRLIENMFTGADKALLNMDAAKKPPEMSIYLSVLNKAGLHRKFGDTWIISEPLADDPCRLLPSFKKVREILERKPDTRVNVLDIFAELKQPPLGLREGLMPILLATFAIANEQDVAFYEKQSFVRHLAGEEFMRLSRNPEAFEIQYCKLSGLRVGLFEKLLEVLELRRTTKAKAALLDIVRPLCIFAAQLPAYVRNTKKLKAASTAVRDVLLATHEPGSLLFTELPKACGHAPFKPSRNDHKRTQQFVTSLKSALDDLKGAHAELLRRIKTAIAQDFNLRGDFSDIRKRLAERAEDIIVHVKEPKLKAFCLRLFDEVLPEAEWLESFGGLLTAKPPSKWADADEELFGQSLHEMTRRFQRVEGLAFGSGKKTGSEIGVRVAITKSDGSEMEQVVYFSAKEEQELTVFESEIRKVIAKDRRIGLAAASRAIWQTILEQK